MIKKKKRHWPLNVLVLLASVCLVLGCLEALLRVLPAHPPQMNDPYRYIETIGERRELTPLHTYHERTPLRFDHHSYYEETDGIVAFHADQFGGRWLTAEEQALAGTNILVLGDSFTYGHGLRYADTYIHQLQKRADSLSWNISLVNLAVRGADSRKTLEVYRRMAGQVPHAAVLYGLHINDVVRFPTSYVITNPLLASAIVEKSRALSFIVRRIHNLITRGYRIRKLTDPSVFSSAFFIANMKAIVTLQEEVQAHGGEFYVVLLPILVDLKKDSFRPLYEGIRANLECRDIQCLDLTLSLCGWNDEDLWILPFDQHPNRRANKIFAERLCAMLEERGICQNQEPQR